MLSSAVVTSVSYTHLDVYKRQVQHDMNLKRSTYEVLQILSISLTDKTHLHGLFDKTNFNDVKDLNDPLIPGLFD